MGKIFSIDSKFFHFMSKVGDCMLLSILWLVFSLPIFTLGASTTALYYTVIKVLREDRGSAVKEFWNGFKSNFIQSTVFFILAYVLLVLWGYACQSAYSTAPEGMSLTVLYVVYFVVVAIEAMWLHYVFSYIARFKDNFFTVLKNTLFICIADLPRSLILMTLFAVVLFVIAVTQPVSLFLLILIPAVYMLLASLILEPVYKKYRKDEETPAPKQIEE